MLVRVASAVPRYFNYRYFLLFLGWTAAAIWYFFLVVAREDIGVVFFGSLREQRELLHSPNGLILLASPRDPQLTALQH